MRMSLAAESLASELLEQSCCTKALSPSQPVVKSLHVAMFRLAGEAAPPPDPPVLLPGATQLAVTSSFDQLRQNGQLLVCSIQFLGCGDEPLIVSRQLLAPSC